jgi:large subunit ribosomal protein L10e
MAGIRPAKCYRWDSPAYTRVSKRPSDSYITGIPGSKVIHFDMGNKKGEFDSKAEIIYIDKIQVRHNSMESARILIQKKLEKNVGLANYYFKINAYPHHVMRENVTATGAGADRVSEGMRKAFGKPIGRAARMHKRQTLFTIKFNDNEARKKTIKKTLQLACNKLPGETKIKFSQIKK